MPRHCSIQLNRLALAVAQVHESIATTNMALAQVLAKLEQARRLRPILEARARQRAQAEFAEIDAEALEALIGGCTAPNRPSGT